MNLYRHFRGTGVALVTPFKNGKVDYASLEAIIEHVINGGVDYLITLGTTGEAITLDSRECREVVDFTIRQVNRRLPLVVGMFGDNNTAKLVDRIRQFNFDGLDAIMSSSPSYNKPTQEGIYRHYLEVADASPLPIIIYNVPSRTASNVEAATTLRLARASEKFLAIKEASPNLAQGMKVIKDKPDNFLVLSGDDVLALPLMACGGDGVISVIANAFPYEFSEMSRAALTGDLAKATAFHMDLLDLHPWLYVDGNPAGIKAALQYLGLCSDEVRLPLVPMTSANKVKLTEEIDRITRTTKIAVV